MIVQAPNSADNTLDLTDSMHKSDSSSSCSIVDSSYSTTDSEEKVTRTSGHNGPVPYHPQSKSTVQKTGKI